jgi:hypothetical protein
MASLEKQAKVTMVLYDVGVFADAEGTRKMVKAPFEVVLMQAADDGAYASFIQPCSIGASEDFFANSLESPEWMHERQGLGYITDQMVIEPSNLGDHEGHSEDWRGCFKIGMI